MIAQRVDLGLVGHVGGEDVAARLGGQFLESVRAPSDPQNTPAAFAEQPNGRGPDARTRPGHHYSSLSHIHSLRSVLLNRSAARVVG